MRNTTLCKLHKVSKGLSRDVKKCWPMWRAPVFENSLFSGIPQCFAPWGVNRSVTHSTYSFYSGEHEKKRFLLCSWLFEQQKDKRRFKLLSAKLYLKEIQNRKRGENFLLEVSRRRYPQQTLAPCHSSRRRKSVQSQPKHEDLFSSF